MLLSIKWDTIKDIDLAGALDDRLLILEDSHDHAGADILHMQHTLAEVVESKKILAGRLMRAVTTIERQREEITELRMRSMRGNIIVLTRVPNIRRCLTRIQLVCSSTLWIKKCTYQMLINCITRAHRMGQSNERNNWMMIAKVALMMIKNAYLTMPVLWETPTFQLGNKFRVR